MSASELLESLRKAERERDTMRETLTHVQARCTELLEEKRQLAGEVETLRDDRRAALRIARTETFEPETCYQAVAHLVRAVAHARAALISEASGEGRASVVARLEERGLLLSETEPCLNCGKLLAEHRSGRCP